MNAAQSNDLLEVLGGTPGVVLEGEGEGEKEKELQSPEGLIHEQGSKESTVAELAKKRSVFHEYT